jgi:U6 snRNA-associated Sm-like protein LSm2
MDAQLFYSFFKTLVGKQVAVELKNDVALVGTLHSVDQYLNIKLLNVSVVEGDKFPQLVRVSHLCCLVVSLCSHPRTSR